MKRTLTIILAIAWVAMVRSALSAAPDGSAEKSFTTPDGVVHLPPYRIVYLPPYLATASDHLHWRYVAIPGFEILSCCDDFMTERFVRWANLNRDLLDALAPGDLQMREAVPATLILLNKKALPQEIAPIAKERSEQMGKKLAKIGTPVMQDALRAIPQVNLKDRDSISADVAWDENSQAFEFDPEHMFFVLAGRKPPPPLWFVEGILNFRYPSPTGNFQITAFELDPEFDQNEEYNGTVVTIHPAVWISREVRNFFRTLSPAYSNDNRQQDHLHQLLIQKMLPLRKVLTKPPPLPADESSESAMERQMLPIRQLFAGSPPPDGSRDAKNLEFDRSGISAGALAAFYGLNANAIEKEQVQFLFDHGADKSSPWRFDLWLAQAPLLERLVFDGMPIKRVLTEAPPVAATDDDKESWFAQAGLGKPAGKDPDENLMRHRDQLVLRNGADPGSPWLLDIWKSQVALFVRWAFDDPTHSRREALWKLARYASRAPLTEEVFQGFFGLTFEQMDRQLYEYMPTAIDDSFVLFPAGFFHIPEMDRGAFLRQLDGDKTPELQLRDPTPAEKGRILGDFERKEVDFVRETLPEYTDLYIMQARSTLLNAYLQGSRDPGLLAALGLFECAVHDDVAARGFLEAAVSAHVVRPRAYVELARIRLASALADPSGPEGKLDAWQTASVLDLLRAAQAQAPPQLDAYLLTAEVLRNAGTPPTAADLALLADGLNLFPFNDDLKSAAAPFEAQPDNDLRTHLLPPPLPEMPAFAQTEKPEAQETPRPAAPLLSPAPAADNVRVGIIIDMTAEGKKIERPTPDRPAYYFPIYIGNKEMGKALTKWHRPPPTLEETKRQMTEALYEQGYRIATKLHPPSLALVFRWGAIALEVLPQPRVQGITWQSESNTRIHDQIGSENMTSLPNINGGAVSANQNEVMTVIAGDRWADLDPDDPQQQEFINLGPRYYLMISALDFPAFTRHKQVLLWRAHVSMNYWGHYLDEVLGPLITAAAPMLGKETTRPQIVSAPLGPLGHVIVGTPEVKDYPVESPPPGR